MMLLLAEIRDGLAAPDFGGEYRAHMEAKRHPGHRAASICAWRLLEAGLRRIGYESMPEVRFLASGKPVFAVEKLHFSISHGGKLAAVVISDQNCAVDVECRERKLEEKLSARCMHENEMAAGMDFFDCWTKKECLGKLSGKGMPSRPCEIDLTQENRIFICKTVSDSEGKAYSLCAAGSDMQIESEWIEL